jgi:hypothetical protein
MWLLRSGVTEQTTNDEEYAVMGTASSEHATARSPIDVRSSERLMPCAMFRPLYNKPRNIIKEANFVEPKVVSLHGHFTEKFAFRRKLRAV